MIVDSTPEQLLPLVVLPERAGALLRDRLGLDPDEELRISYITGPGDVQGTYEYWLKGELDPRVPTVAKTAMFYGLCRQIGARGQLVADVQPGRKDSDFGKFRFDYIPRHRVAGRLSYYWGTLRRIADAQRAIRKFKPHFIVACTDFPGYGLPILRLGEAKLVFSLHNTFWTKGQRPSGLKDRITNIGRRIWLRSAGAALCTSLECELQFQELTGGKIKTFRNMPQQRRPSGEPRMAVAREPRKILYLGRIEPAKGIYDLLDACKALRAKYADFELIFAGDGSASDELTNLIAAHGDPQIRFVGRLSADKVFEELQDTYVLICPTQNAFREGLALVCIESAVYGVPSIMSTAVPAAYLLPDSGDVYEADSVEDLTAAIDKILADPGLRQSRSQAALQESENFFRRDLSWGTYLYQAMIEAAKR